MPDEANKMTPEEIVAAIYHNGETFVRKGMDFMIGSMRLDPVDASYTIGYMMKFFGEALIEVSKEADLDCVLRNADVAAVIDGHMEAFGDTLPKPS